MPKYLFDRGIFINLYILSPKMLKSKLVNHHITQLYFIEEKFMKFLSKKMRI